MNWLRDERGLTSAPTTSCGGGRSTTWTASGPRSGTSLGCGDTRRTSVSWVRGRCPAPSGSRAPGSTTPSICSAMTGTDELAVNARSQTRPPQELTFGDLRDQAARLRRGCSASASVPATASSPTCRTSPRRWWRSSPPRAWGDLGGLRPRVRRPQRGRSLRPDRAPACRWRRAGTATATATPNRRAELAAIRAGLPTLEHVVAVPYGERRSSPMPSAGPTCSPTRARRNSEPVPFAHSAVRAVLLGYHRPAQGDRPRPRRAAGRAPQEPGPGVGPRPASGCSGSRPIAWSGCGTRWSHLFAALRRSWMLDGDPVRPDLMQQWRVAEQTRADGDSQPGVPDGCRKAGLSLGVSAI